MLTDGGAMSGYCSIGSDRMPPIPASMVTIAITHAKIGRSMQGREIIRRSAPRGPAAAAAAAAAGAGALPRRRACRHRLDLLAGLDPDQPLDDHLVARVEAGGDDPLVADRAVG